MSRNLGWLQVGMALGFVGGAAIFAKSDGAWIVVVGMALWSLVCAMLCFAKVRVGL